MCTLLNCMLVFYKKFLWYFCFLWIFKFLFECVQLQSCHSRLHHKMHSHFYHFHTKLSNEFLLTLIKILNEFLLILIKIYHLFTILYSSEIISWINTIKFRFILIILLYFKIMHWKPCPALIFSFHCSNRTLSCTHCYKFFTCSNCVFTC